jgi:outer membrane protein TolC
LHSLEQQSLEALEEERQHYFALWLAALEVVDSLRHQYQQQRKVIIALESRVRLSRKALDSARDRYILGDQNYLEVLIALRRLQDTDRSLIAEQLRLVTLWVELAEAAGRPLCQDLKCSNS